MEVDVFRSTTRMNPILSVQCKAMAMCRRSPTGDFKGSSLTSLCDQARNAVEPGNPCKVTKRREPLGATHAKDVGYPINGF